MQGIPYPIHQASEAYYHSLLYLCCWMLGYEVQAEVMTSNGRIDLVLSTEKTTILFELKINSSAQKAMEQIQTKGYADKYLSRDLRVIMVGANFSTTTRSIDSWEATETT